MLLGVLLGLHYNQLNAVERTQSVATEAANHTFFFVSVLLTIREFAILGEIVSVFKTLTTKCSRRSRKSERGRAQNLGGRRPPKWQSFGRPKAVDCH